MLVILLLDTAPVVPAKGISSSAFLAFSQRGSDGSATNPYCSLIFLLKVLSRCSAWSMGRSSHPMSHSSALRRSFSCLLLVILLDLLLFLKVILIASSSELAAWSSP